MNLITFRAVSVFIIIYGCSYSLMLWSKAKHLNPGGTVNWWDEPDEHGEGDLGGAALGEGVV
jgi:hypothetical protein